MKRKGEKFWAVICPDGIMIRNTWPYGPALFYTKDSAKKYASSNKYKIVKVRVIEIDKAIEHPYHPIY